MVTAHTTTDAGRTASPAAHLSASQLRTYSTCSLQWFCQRHYKPEFVASALVFGSAVHAAIETYYQGFLEGREVAVDEMFEAYEAVWGAETGEIQYGKKASRESLAGKAAAMLDAFLASVQPGEVVAVEQPFECALSEGLPPLVGRIDLVEVVGEEKGDPALHVVDFKTAARATSDPDDLDTSQLTFYAIAAHRLGLVAQLGLPLKMRYDIITKTKSPKVLSYSFAPDHGEGVRVVAKARACWRGMAAEIVFPTPSWMCTNCGYKRLCAQWPQLPEKER